MPNTSRGQFTYPGVDDPNDIERYFREQAERLALIAAFDYQGTLANRPAAGERGRFYTVIGDPTASNNGRTYRDDGSAWRELLTVADVTSPGLTAGLNSEGNSYANLPNLPIGRYINAWVNASDALVGSYFKAPVISARSYNGGTLLVFTGGQPNTVTFSYFVRYVGPAVAL